MVCLHLINLENELVASEIKITFRGQAWSKNCGEWVYFDCIFLDLGKTIERLLLDKQLIKVHSHLGTHDGQEYGLICTKCNDGIMGLHPEGSRKEGVTGYI